MIENILWWEFLLISVVVVGLASLPHVVDWVIDKKEDQKKKGTGEQENR